MSSSRESIRFSTVLGVFALTAIALAGPEFLEDDFGDAGSFPKSALELPGGAGNSGVIRGRLTRGPMPGGGDFEDMYFIEVVDEITFRAETFFDDGFTDFDTQLFLFATDGTGLLASDDSSEDATEVGSLLLPMSTDGTFVEILPGNYYLAISGAGNVPLDAAGLEIFAIVDPMEVSGPDGPAGTEPIGLWSGGGATGSYTIYLTGVAFPAASPCVADLDSDGDVDVDDLLLLLGAWGTCSGPCPPSCVGDINLDCVVDVDDLLALIAAWGPCP